MNGLGVYGYGLSAVTLFLVLWVYAAIIYTL